MFQRMEREAAAPVPVFANPTVSASVKGLPAVVAAGREAAWFRS